MGYVFGCFWEIIDLQYPVAMETQFMEAFLDDSGCKWTRKSFPKGEAFHSKDVCFTCPLVN